MSKSRRRRHTRHYHGDARDPYVTRASQRLSPPRKHVDARPVVLEVESRHPDQESAIAAALEASEPGDVVEIHEANCPVSAIAEPTQADLDACGCEVLIAQVGGARA